jgi:hypothetical protein
MATYMTRNEFEEACAEIVNFPAMKKYVYVSSNRRMVYLGQGVAQPQTKMRNILTNEITDYKNTDQPPVQLNDAMIAHWLETGTDEER